MNRIIQLILQQPIWAMAFRPLYLLSAIYGALAMGLWAMGFSGTRILPAHFWHAHEMIWGYAGAIVVGFLLTAVATWTGEPPTRGKPLILLVMTWLLARISVFFETGIDATHLFGTLFYGLGAYFLGLSVFKTRNKRNYIAVLALIMLGLSHSAFHFSLSADSFNPIALTNSLHAGLLLIASFIALIGNRIIPFFTSKRLNSIQIETNAKWVQMAFYLPLLASIFKILNILNFFNCLIFMVAGLLALSQSVRWFDKRILKEPMLWILHLGYVMTGLGLLAFGLGWFLPTFNSLGIHLIAVGGIGLLTLGMMTRTALGHTARPLYPAPKGMTSAFVLMFLATFFRALSAVMVSVNTTAYVHSYRLAGACFVGALLIFVWRYARWLCQPRLDGKMG